MGKSGAPGDPGPQGLHVSDLWPLLQPSALRSVWGVTWFFFCRGCPVGTARKDTGAWRYDCILHHSGVKTNKNEKKYQINETKLQPPPKKKTLKEPFQPKSLKQKWLKGSKHEWQACFGIRCFSRCSFWFKQRFLDASRFSALKTSVFPVSWR